jgi:hypothetical protein
MSGVGPTVFLLPSSSVESKCGACAGEGGIGQRAGGRRPARDLPVLVDAGAGHVAAQEEGSVAAPAAGQSQIPSRAAPGTLLLPRGRGRALEVAVAEAPPMVQRSRCPCRPLRGGGKGVGEAWPPSRRPPSVPPPPERGREPPEGGGWTEEPDTDDIGWEGEGVIKCDVWEKKACGAHP